MSEFRGKLYVFVDKIIEGDSAEIGESGNLFTLRAPGDVAWFLTGQAVGNHSRGPYCSRTSATKMRSFGTFASTMDFVRQKRKARPHESFHLVYAVDGRKSVIKSLEQIQRMDGTSTARTVGNPELAEAGKVAQLEAAVGKIVAGNALALLKILTDEGEEAARARFAGATYTRLWQALVAAGLREN